MEQEQSRVQFDARFIQVSVAAIRNFLGNILGLSVFEAMVMMGQAIEDLENASGMKYDHASKTLRPKTQAPPPVQQEKKSPRPDPNVH